MSCFEMEITFVMKKNTAHFAAATCFQRIVQECVSADLPLCCMVNPLSISFAVPLGESCVCVCACVCVCWHWPDMFPPRSRPASLAGEWVSACGNDTHTHTHRGSLIIHTLTRRRWSIIHRCRFQSPWRRSRTGHCGYCVCV